jgi:hypothetical protein
MSKLLVDEISDADNTGPVTVTDGLNVSSGNVGIGGTVVTDGSITDTGDFTIDVGTYIILDADQDGNIYLNDAGVGYGQLSGASGNFTMKCPTSNKNIIFTGNDGGSPITALTLDMSEAGEATFNSDIKLNDGKVARFGTDQDFRIGFDGTDAVLQNVTSDSDIIFKGNDDGSSITALTLDMSNGGTATFYRKIIVSAADGVADADYVASFTNNESTSGRSFGLSIGAGTSGSDIALNVVNQAGDTTLLRVHGNGATTIGNSLTLADGNLVVAAGHGIDFSAVTGGTGTATSNLLDDYEEGSFTATLTSAVAPTSPPTASGRYTKIGRSVTISIFIENGDTSGGSGVMRIDGLPFEAGAAVGNRGSGPVQFYNMTFSGDYCVAEAGGASTSIYFRSITSNAVWSDQAITAGTGKYLQTTMTYTTA